MRSMVHPSSVDIAGDTIACPSCQEAIYDCEACLHHHLQAAHGIRYSQVYGQMPDPWSELCAAHTAEGTAMVGC